jgi:hypothetical protein
MNSADTHEIATALNILLEAERAGTRVALAMRKQADSPETAAFMANIEKDEAHWCAQLKTSIEALGVLPSMACGDFYEKTMAIEDTVERLRFLNRGQSWVVRKIETLRPRLPEGRLHDVLSEMSERHLSNIAATDAFIATLAER